MEDDLKTPKVDMKTSLIGSNLKKLGVIFHRINAYENLKEILSVALLSPAYYYYRKQSPHYGGNA